MIGQLDETVLKFYLYLFIGIFVPLPQESDGAPYIRARSGVADNQSIPH